VTTLQPSSAGLSADRRTRLTAPLLSAVGAVAALTLLHLRDPHVAGSYAACPWLHLTGFACPGCGGLRAVHDLTHGDLAGALSSNLLVVALLLPLAVVAWLAWTRGRWRGRRFALPPLSRPVAWFLLVLILAFGLVRNLAFGSWLAP
jgi:hypothetical protein